MVDTIVSSVGSNVADDYTSLAAWWADKKGDIVTATEIQVAELRGEEHDVGIDPIVSMNSAECTVSADYYYIVRTMDGAEFHGDVDDVASVARLKSSNGGSLIFCSVDYTRYEDFLVVDSVCTSAIYNTAGDYVIIKNVGVDNLSKTLGSNSLTIYAIYNYSSGTDTINCVVNNVYGQVTGSDNAKNCTVNGIVSGSVFNCTVANVEADNDSTGSNCNAYAYGMGNCAQVYNSLAMLTTASAVSGNATANDFNSGGTKDYNASEDGTTTGGNSITITPADEVTDVAKATFDCHLKAGADCIKDGTDLSGEGFSDDIDGDSRPYDTTWCIGADEYTGAGPTGWTHKIHGIAAASMAKVNSVAKANIAKINQT